MSTLNFVSLTFQITKVMIVPPIVLFLARHPMVANYDLSSIQEVLSAAAPLGESLTYEFMDKVKLPIYQGKLPVY